MGLSRAWWSSGRCGGVWGRMGSEAGLRVGSGGAECPSEGDGCGRPPSSSRPHSPPLLGSTPRARPQPGGPWGALAPSSPRATPGNPRSPAPAGNFLSPRGRSTALGIRNAPSAPSSSRGPPLQVPVPDVGPSPCRSSRALWLLTPSCRCWLWGWCLRAPAHVTGPPKRMAKST